MDIHNDCSCAGAFMNRPYGTIRPDGAKTAQSGHGCVGISHRETNRIRHETTKQKEQQWQKHRISYPTSH